MTVPMREQRRLAAKARADAERHAAFVTAKARTARERRAARPAKQEREARQTLTAVPRKSKAAREAALFARDFEVEPSTVVRAPEPPEESSPRKAQVFDVVEDLFASDEDRRVAAQQVLMAPVGH